MSKRHTIEEVDKTIQLFSLKNNVKLIRLSEYININTPMKIKNIDTGVIAEITYKQLYKALKTNKKIFALMLCEHQHCSYIECIHQRAKLIESELIDIYINSDKVQLDIAEKLNIHPSQAAHILTELEINKKYEKERRQRKANQAFCYNPFEDMDANAHWLLGYILADGCIGDLKRDSLRKSLNITSVDLELIQHCCNIFKLDYSYIKVTRSNRNIKSGEIHTYYSLNIVDNHVVDSLMNLGVIPRKSYEDTTKLQIKSEFKFDFLRGLFDGDGSASSGMFSVTGHKSYMRLLTTYFPSLKYTEKGRSNLADLYVTSVGQSIWLYNKMYHDGYLPCLTRKREKLYEMIKNLELTKVDDFTKTDNLIPVCDLNVHGSHTFFANDIYVHNCDFNAEEIRIPALWSGEPAWVEAFKSGNDVHKATAIAIWGEENYDKSKRKKAKQANFGILYGMTARNFANDFGISLEEGEEFVNQFKTGLPTLFNWVAAVEKMAMKQGTVSTMFGRPRRVKHWLESNEIGLVNFGKRTAINTIIQGTGADILKLVMIKLFEQFYKTENMSYLKHIRFKNTIHDEINYQIRKESLAPILKTVLKIMRVRLEGWPFPMEVGLSLGNRWGQSVDFKFNTETLEVIEPKYDPYFPEEEESKEVEESEPEETITQELNWSENNY